jgi:hypothetical protein
MPRFRGPQERYFLNPSPWEKADLAKKIRRLPEDKRKLRYSVLKVVGALEAGYTVDQATGAVIGKKGKPLKTYVPVRPDGTVGVPLVDVRTKLPFPFHKTKIDVQKAVLVAAHGAKALHNADVQAINGDVRDTRLSNLNIVAKPPVKRAKSVRGISGG